MAATDATRIGGLSAEKTAPAAARASGISTSTANDNLVRERKRDAVAGDAAKTASGGAMENGGVKDASDKNKEHDGDKVMGRTPNGSVFVVPHTPDMLTSIFAPNKPKTALDVLTIVSLALQLVLFFVLSGTTRKAFFLVYFAFWRAAYDGGLGYILNEQSLRKYITKTVQREGWFDANRRPKAYAWVKNHLRLKMDTDYRFDDMPLEYNVWLLFRSIVDVILLNDFVAYSLFAFSCTRLPEGHSVGLHVLRWIAGWTLIFFNLWVKMDAHRVVKDYAWYWGDCFFLCLQSLVFDGVYECAPDPMYSLGYAGYYGLSLVSGSYAVFCVSLAAHFAQFLFLKYFEGPHIDRVYGEKKPLAARVPLRKAPLNAASAQEAVTPGLSGKPADGSDELFSVSSVSASQRKSQSSDRATQSTASEDDFSIDEDDGRLHAKAQKRQGSRGKHTRMSSRGRPEQINNLHDLHHKLFQHDTVVFRNLDPFRGTDFLLLVAVFYGLVPHLLPSSGPRVTLAFYWLNALGWRLIHSFGLGALLHAQSEHKWVVRHYLKHYVYTHSSDAVYAAFSNWKVIYNTSLVMTYLSFGVLCWKCYVPLGRDWTAGTDLLRHMIGSLLIALHVWSATSSYSVLGPFGWLYGDFFIDEYPHQLYYTGIYRFLNNPERTMGGAAFFGLVLISGSKLALSMAVISYLAHWIFLSWVENPHMTKLYGQAAVARQGGVSKQIKSVAERNSVFSVAQSHPRFREVKAELQRYQRDASSRIEEFVTRSRPALEGVVKDTRMLLQQSKDRMLVVRRGNDMDTIDRSQYDIKVLPPSSGSRFGKYLVGEPLRVQWTAPPTHSNRDWIGIYHVLRFGSERAANDARLLTTISSQGKWRAVVEDEWDGNTPTNDEETASKSSRQGANQTHGVVTFSGDRLPWAPGVYEVRYHHDAKHDVLARTFAFEIAVEPLSDPASFAEVHQALSKIVAFALDTPPLSASSDTSGSASASDATHMGKHGDGDEGSPEGAKSTGNPSAHVDDDDDEALAGTDPDDFTIWDVHQAKRIATGIHACFGLEFTTEVIVAEANVGKLAQDIVEARQVLS